MFQFKTKFKGTGCLEEFVAEVVSLLAGLNRIKWNVPNGYQPPDIALHRAGESTQFIVTIPDNSTSGVLSYYKVLSEQADYLICYPVTEVSASEYSVEAGAETVTVYKPYLLRKTPFNGQTINGITYTFPTANKRIADDGAETEVQKITPSYFVDEIITVSGSSIKQDINTAGRCWALTDESELEPDDVPLGDYVPTGG